MTDLSQAAVAVKKNPTALEFVQQNRKAIEAQLAGAVNSESFIRTVTTVLRNDAKLQAADPLTVMGGVMLAAQLKLEVGAGLGEFYLTPRLENRNKPNEKWVCLPIIGYQGFIKLVLRSEMVTDVHTFLVRDGDLFEFGANAREGKYFEWKPKDFEEEREWTGVVAVARMKAGGTTWVYLTKNQVFKRRPSYWNNGTPWQTHEEEMAQKTAVRALTKFLPKSTELGTAIEADEQKVSHVSGLDDLAIQAPDEDVHDAEVVEDAAPAS